MRFVLFGFKAWNVVNTITSPDQCPEEVKPGETLLHLRRRGKKKKKEKKKPPKSVGQIGLTICDGKCLHRPSVLYIMVCSEPLYVGDRFGEIGGAEMCEGSFSVTPAFLTDWIWLRHNLLNKCNWRGPVGKALGSSELLAFCGVKSLVSVCLKTEININFYWKHFCNSQRKSDSHKSTRISMCVTLPRSYR